MISIVNMLDETIPVIYQNERYEVNYNSLHNSSLKFRQLIKPFIEDGSDLHKLQLRILYNKFNSKNVNNFLKICQNQQNDVLDNEVEEICELAKMFKADQIYNIGINFVHNRIDPNFNIANNFDESNGQKYLAIESDKSIFEHHSIDFNELEFDDDIELTDSKLDEKQVIIKKVLGSNAKKNVKLACYQIIINKKKMMKCRRFYFLKGNKVLYMAKQKMNEIFIGEGDNFHIHERKFENSASILQNGEGYNIINTDDQEFKVIYVPIGSKKQYSLRTSFIHNGSKLDWSPKEVVNLNNLNGQYNHAPMPSKKNIILKNKSGHPTFLVKKVAKKTYEIECYPTLSPLVIFSLGISEIVGPYAF